MDYTVATPGSDDEKLYESLGGSLQTPQPVQPGPAYTVAPPGSDDEKLYESLPSATPQTASATPPTTPTAAKPGIISAARQGIGNFFYELYRGDKEDNEPETPVDKISSDVALSSANQIPFATRAYSASQAALDAAQGDGYDYSNRLKTNQDYIKSRQDQYPNYKLGTLPYVGPVSLNGFDLMGAPLASLAPIGVGAKIAASGASVPAKILAGALTGGTAGAVQGLSSSPDLTQYGDDFKRAGLGAAVGVGIGGFVPALSSAVGGVAEKAANAFQNPFMSGFTPTVSKDLIAALKGGAPDISTSLSENLTNFGPRGTLGDATPLTQQAVKTLASQEGEHNPILTDAFANRDPNKVITDAVNDPVNGTPLSQTQLEKSRELQQEQKDFGQNIMKPVMEGASDVPAGQVSPILDKINEGLKTAVGPERTALLKIQEDLTAVPAKEAVPANPGTWGPDPTTQGRTNTFIGKTPGSPAEDAIPHTNPQLLHNTKQHIDFMSDFGEGTDIPKGAVSKTTGTLGEIRGMLDDTLKGNSEKGMAGVPGYSDAMDQYSSLYKQRQALNDGAEEVLKPGVNAQDFKTKYDAMSPEEQAAQKIGMTHAINNTLADKANDVSAMKTLLQGTGEDGNNYQKIAHVFGKNTADNLSNSVNAATQMTKTNSMFNAGIRSGAEPFGKEIADKLQKMQNPAKLINTDAHNLTWEGAAASVPKAAINAVGDVFGKRVNPNTYTVPFAKALASSGQDAQNILAEALRKAPIAARNAAIGKNSQNIFANLLNGSTIPAAVAISNSKGQ